MKYSTRPRRDPLAPPDPPQVIINGRVRNACPQCGGGPGQLVDPPCMCDPLERAKRAWPEKARKRAAAFAAVARPVPSPPTKE